MRLAHAGEANGRAGDFFDAERGAAARVAVELGQDDAGEVEALVEALATIFTASWPIIASTTRKMFSGCDLRLDVGELLP